MIKKLLTFLSFVVYTATCTHTFCLGNLTEMYSLVGIVIVIINDNVIIVLQFVHSQAYNDDSSLTSQYYQDVHVMLSNKLICVHFCKFTD